MVFLHPVPSAKSISSLYDTHYEFTVSDRGKRRFEAQAAHIFTTIRSISPDAKTLLDVGSGPGTFVEMAQSAGFTALGIEPAKNLYQESLRLPITTINAEFEAYFKKNPRKKFDVISLIHVVEHLRNPEKALRLIANHLHKNGILFIETPNIDSHLFDVEQTQYTFLTPPAHINLFSANSVKAIAQRLGISIGTVATYSYPEHFMAVIRRIKRAEVGKKSAAVGNSTKHSASTQTHTLPFIDAHIAPALTPILNIGTKGSILQTYLKKN